MNEDFLKGLNAQKVHEALLPEFRRREESIKKQVFAQIAKGLEPQFAVQKWLELHAIHQLETTLMQKQRQHG